MNVTHGRHSRQDLIRQTLNPLSPRRKPQLRRLNPNNGGAGFYVAPGEELRLGRSAERSGETPEKEQQLERLPVLYSVDLGGVTREGRNSTLNSNTNGGSSKCDSSKHRLLTSAIAHMTAR